MLSIDTETPTYYLWRFMIGADYQGRGYGRAAIAAIVAHVRSLPGATELLVSWVPAEGGPEPFYLGLGFVPTGKVEDGEVEGRLALD
jgi:diamine N-acetyltransferase